MPLPDLNWGGLTKDLQYHWAFSVVSGNLIE